MTVYKSLPVAELIEAYRAGSGLRKLAGKYGVSYGTIRHVLGAAGVELRAIGRRAEPIRPGDVTHKIKSIYKSSWDELPAPPALHEGEVARLRQAVGWKPEWVSSKAT